MTLALWIVLASGALPTEACDALVDLDQAYNDFYLAMDETGWGGIPEGNPELDAAREDANVAFRVVEASLKGHDLGSFSSLDEIRDEHREMEAAWKAGDIGEWEGNLGQAQAAAKSAARQNCTKAD